MAMLLFSIPRRLFCRLKRYQVMQLEPLVDWVSSRNMLNRWLLPRLKIAEHRFYGPKNRLANITIEEFTYTEAAYERYENTSDTDYLDTLVAVLYRKKAWFRGRRKFNPAKLEAGEKLARQLPRYVKLAVAINYAGCRNFIIAKHPHIWVPTEAKADTPAPGAPTNWTQLVLNLSGDKFGTYNQTQQMNLWLVLADFQKKAKDYAELEARLKK